MTNVTPINVSSHNVTRENGKLFAWLPEEEMYIHITDVQGFGEECYVNDNAPRYRIHATPNGTTRVTQMQ